MSRLSMSSADDLSKKGLPVIDPLKFIYLHWPDTVLSPEQIAVVQSVWDNDETSVVAGNQLGKDYITSLIVLAYFLTHHPVRIITTSVADKHLAVLWGEIDARIRSSRYAITTDQGGPVVYNAGAHELWKTHGGVLDKESYCVAIVAEKPEKFSGHHAKYTLMVGDECSGIDQKVYDKCVAWAKRRLWIGNAWPCDNFFKWAFKGRPGSKDAGGDIRAEDNGHYHRKTFRLKAEDSPNVKLALIQKRSGKEITNEELVPGILSYREYLERRALWDAIMQMVGLDADWYEGPGLYLFPNAVLDLCARLALGLTGKRPGLAMGIDTAQGGDNTAWAVVDSKGLIALKGKKTPNTAVITGETIAIGREFNVPPEDWVFDRGGGGKEHADRLRAQGYPVRTVAFGEAATMPPKRGMTTFNQRIEAKEVQYVYRNKRAEMYGMLMIAVNNGFALPAELLDQPRADGGPSLRRQLAPIPLRYDEEGRLKLLPKNRRNQGDEAEECLADLIGCSPDEADAVVLAHYGMKRRPIKSHVEIMS